MAKIIKNEDNLITFEFEISPDDFRKATNAVYKRTKGRFSVPGFRKGHAPKGIIEKQYGEGIFYEDALNDLLPSEMDKAINELDIKLAARADVDITELEPKTSIIIQATAPVVPEFELGDYKDVEVEIESLVATDEDVENMVNAELKKNARIVEVEDRAAELDDTVIIDFKGMIDGEVFEGSSANNYSLKLGSNSFIPGFEEQIIGKDRGEEFDVNVTFPETYHAEDLAGKDAVFSVKIHEIKEEKVPELDDDFVMDVSEFDTVDEYKEDLKAKITEEKQARAENVKRGAALNHLADITVIDIHDRAIDEEVEEMLREFEQNLSRSGLDLETYVKFTGGDIEAIKADMRETAEARIKNDYILNKIIKLEEIEVSDEEVEAEIEKLATEQGVNLKELKKIYKSDNYGYLKSHMAKNKAMDLLVENAKFKETL